MTDQPAKSDPEIAAALFGSDLGLAMGTARAGREGWKLTAIDPLTAIVEVVAGDAGPDHTYFLKLEGDWYNQYPPRVTFVTPDPDTGWPVAGEGSRWLPSLEHIHPGFLLHAAFEFPDKSKGQLVCSSVNFDYYWTNHTPAPGQVWVQGTSRLTWTLGVVQDELSGVGYKGPSGAADS